MFIEKPLCLYIVYLERGLHAHPVTEKYSCRADVIGPCRKPVLQAQTHLIPLRIDDPAGCRVVILLVIGYHRCERIHLIP